MGTFSDSMVLVSRLERTAGYPRSDDGVEFLARGLQKASATTGIKEARIVERCAEISRYCPTDSDLLTVAKDIARLDALAGGTFDSQAGAGNHVAANPPRSCPKCHGTGWEIVYALHTFEGGQHNFVRKERITEDRANELWPKIDTRKQMIYSGARRCHCPVPAERVDFPQDERSRS